jgi:hypothetical protein
MARDGAAPETLGSVGGPRTGAEQLFTLDRDHLYWIEGTMVLRLRK